MISASVRLRRYRRSRGSASLQSFLCPTFGLALAEINSRKFKKIPLSYTSLSGRGIKSEKLEPSKYGTSSLMPQEFGVQSSNSFRPREMNICCTGLPYCRRYKKGELMDPDDAQKRCVHYTRLDRDCNSLRKGDPPYTTDASFTGVTTLSDLSIAGGSLYEPDGSYPTWGGFGGRFILNILLY